VAGGAGPPRAPCGFRGGARRAGDAADPDDPTVRRGVIRRTGTLAPGTPAERSAIVVSADVQSGDSGGPVVDAAGAVRGIVIQRGEGGGGIAEQATEVRQLLEDEGVTPGEGPAGEAFRGGMAALWALDLDAAEAGFGRTLRADPAHALAERERTRVRELAASAFSLRAEDRREGILLAVAILAIAAAAGCAVALAWPSLTRSEGRGGGQ
jgi:hypothetical protein